MSGGGEKPRPSEPKSASAKVFTHGGSQAVRLPKAFRLDGDRVNVRLEGKAVILEPMRQGGAELWARIDAIVVDGPLDYVQQPVIEDMAFDW